MDEHWDEMTFKEFVEDLSKVLENHPEWADKPLEFCTIDRSGLLYLSVYDSDDGKTIQIDVGTEEDDEENNERLALEAGGMNSDIIPV